ncbi:ATPase AAA-2 domain protein [Burkholderia sp. BT03]|nr:ATPase AAA-2 domain protein [Burkholderia sp. BT03]
MLTEAVRQRPYSVILLDEVEKAHRDVLNLFYQVFDRGFMRDGEGRIIDFRNTVILMTSNLASEQIVTAFDTTNEAASEVAQDAAHRVPVSDALLMERVRPVLVEHFQPALLARFQSVIYRPLSTAALGTIVRMKLDKVAHRIAKRFEVALICDDTLIDEVVRACQTPDSGARNIDSLLDQQILPVLSRELLVRSAKGKLPATIRLSVSETEGVIVDFEEALLLDEAAA